MHKLTAKGLAALCGLAITTCSLEARVVITKTKQNEILNIARELLSSPAGAAELKMDELKDPFHFPKKEEPKKEEVVEEVAPVVETVRELDDSEILSLVSRQLKPSGFIDQGGQQYLILNGKKVKDGVSFNFPHQEKLYSILISEIQTNSFTLNLNSESKKISME
ncbi:MAG: hypothetical protein KJT03_00855 [Verrucomicrobiae bacterium]|nr:hypothetical protein [Verrucomicrobiae bacterium]